MRPGARPPPLTVSRPHPRAAHRHLLVCAPQDILGEVHERRDGIKEWIGTSKDVLTALKDIVIPEEGVSLSKLYSMCKKSKGDGAWAGSIKLLSQGAGAAIADEVQIQDGEEPSAARDRVQVKVTANKRRSKMLQALYPLLVGMLGRLQNGKRQIDEAIDFVLMLLPIVATEARQRPTKRRRPRSPARSPSTTRARSSTCPSRTPSSRPPSTSSTRRLRPTRRPPRPTRRPPSRPRWPPTTASRRSAAGARPWPRCRRRTPRHER